MSVISRLVLLALVPQRAVVSQSRMLSHAHAGKENINFTLESDTGCPFEIQSGLCRPASTIAPALQYLVSIGTDFDAVPHDEPNI
ncbi:uncharacterized protein EDB93DRAFT_1145000 [Suillus bovinus]|uniref:uncharacterized protein n=1 Tax=Suillus bovinus TaxID=48563 RepID=UPI001B87CA2A|nr:uncharacterized protein EDB93DRAFT_1145000 [Suillus bovinus]KAG2148187.1 hypothetical protein EDB93DRAFT_1145000 [Suillus bovinus]